MGYPVTLIHGSNTDVTDALRVALEATGVVVDWTVFNLGRQGSVPPAVIASIQATKAAIVGPISEEVDRLIQRQLCQQLDLYARVQRIHTATTSQRHLDWVIIHGTTEDLSAGLEFERTTPEAADLREYLAKLSGLSMRADAAIGIKSISVLGSRRIVESACDYAQVHGRQTVTAVHQADLMPHTDGLFLEIARAVSQDYDDLLFKDQTVNDACQQLLQGHHDILVMPHLYGEILTALCIAIAGVDATSSAMLGDESAVFAPVGSSSLADPTVLISSGAMMLQHLGEEDAAQRLETAVARVIERYRPLANMPPASEIAVAIAQAL